MFLLSLYYHVKDKQDSIFHHMFGLTHNRDNDNVIGNNLDLNVYQLKIKVLIQMMMSTISIMSNTMRIDTMIDTIIILNQLYQCYHNGMIFNNIHKLF